MIPWLINNVVNQQQRILYIHRELVIAYFNCLPLLLTESLEILKMLYGSWDTSQLFMPILIT